MGKTSLVWSARAPDRAPDRFWIEHGRAAAAYHVATRFTHAASQPTSSRYKGVTWHKGTGKWVGQICANGCRKHLGYFDSEIAAAYKALKELTKEGRFAP